MSAMKFRRGRPVQRSRRLIEMGSMGLAAVVGATVLLGLVGTLSCDSTEVLAPTDGSITMSANPTEVIIDRTVGETEGQSAVEARVFDASGFPLSGIDLIFSADGGALASGTNSCISQRCSISGGACTVNADCPVTASRPVSTDDNGRAVDVLTISENDASSITVTASSATLSQTVVVTKTNFDGNVLPTAVITANPADRQRTGEFVVFDGGTSSDPDGQITCYFWEINADEAADTEVIVGPTSVIVSRQYNTEQTLDVTLRVSDEPDSGSFCFADPLPSTSLFSPRVAMINNYEIGCDFTPPNVQAGANRNVQLSGGTVDVTLTGSSDDDDEPDVTITSEQWTCEENDSDPPPEGATATCTYTTAGQFTATFEATNSCGLTASDTVIITVTDEGS